MKFSKIELRDLAVCWVSLSLCFSLGMLFTGAGDPFATSLLNFFVVSLASLLAMGTGFLIHEICHKATAQHFNCWAEFRTWMPGLIISIATAVLSFGTFIFFAPGAVHVRSYRDLSRREDGLISSSGPASNLLMAALFLGLYALRHSFGTAGEFMWSVNLFGHAVSSYPYNIFTLLGRLGFQMNLWLAAFNLIPFGPLDGLKIFRWNKWVWGTLTLLSWGTIIIMSLGVVNIL